MFKISQTGDTVRISFGADMDDGSIPQVKEELDAVLGFRGLKEMNVVADISGNRSPPDDLDYMIEDLVPALKNMGAKDVRIV